MTNQQKENVVILGAGPAGLAMAYEIIVKSNKYIPIIIDKLPCVGGLSRTVYMDKNGVDIGGHRLYTKDEYVKGIWNKFLPLQNAPSIDDILAKRTIRYPQEGANPQTSDNVMLIRKRYSSIIYNSKSFEYPIKFSLSTFLKLGIRHSFLAGMSYMKSILFKRKVSNLEDFMVNRFGSVLYETFFKDYTKKVWGVGAQCLSSEWGSERIRKLSLFKTILNSILSVFKFLNFNKETSLIDEFYYPKYGCSQLWQLMADYIVSHGGKIILNSEFVDFSVENNIITGVKIKNNDAIHELNSNYFASSIPVADLIKGIDAPFNIKQNALNLPYRDYILAGFYVDKFNLKNKTNFKTVNNITPECWIYVQEKDAICARIQIMNNWSPYLVEDFENKYLISLEYFANENDNLWSKSDDDIIKLAVSEAKKYNLFEESNVLNSFVIREKKAYPTYMGTYSNIDKIKEYLSTVKNLKLIGRNGRHKYCNMDEAMISGIEAAREICLGE